MENTPSLTAKGAALHRAAHQLLEGGEIFTDPLAVTICGEDAAAITRFAREHPENSRLRLFIVARSRFAEECLAHAVERSARQVVVLGAGLDTFELRNPYAVKGLRVFEVDRPATQQWKRECLEKAGLQIPSWLSFVSVDFERQSLLERLKTMGFKDDQPAFFTWLGVVPYLSRDAVLATLSLIARIPDAEVVFEYGRSPAAYPPERRAGYEAMIARAAALGEPWLSFFNPDELANELSRLGFHEVEDLSPSEVAIRYFGERDPPHNAPGGHFVRARRRR
jgi:methyltransferase (TIGR00027 family)